MAALSSDLAKVQAQVEQAGEALASDPAASVAVSDTAAMLETMHEMHVGHLLPRTGAAHAAVEAFATQCLDCKVRGLGAGRGGGPRLRPACRALAAEPWLSSANPTSHTCLCTFCIRQNALTRDVLGQLRTISSQQSKIREVKNKLALFR